MSIEDNKVKNPGKRSRRNRSEEVLQAATKLFGAHGFQGTTLAMVAESVGLTEQGVLHYFPSKVHLLQGVLAYRDEKDFERFSTLIEAEIENVAAFFAILEGLWAENEKVPVLIQLFTVLAGESISGEHPSHAFFVDRYRRGREVYVQQFQRVEIRSDVNLDDLATLMLAMTDGLQLQWLLDPEQVDTTATFGLFSAMVVAYLDRS